MLKNIHDRYTEMRQHTIVPPHMRATVVLWYVVAHDTAELKINFLCATCESELVRNSANNLWCCDTCSLEINGKELILLLTDMADDIKSLIDPENTIKTTTEILPSKETKKWQWVQSLTKLWVWLRSRILFQNSSQKIEK